jgi:N-acetylmuramoyl-L-alanine amidase
MIIYLSPSLQENNVGVGTYGTEEKRMNELTDILEGLLADCGHTIYRNCPTWTLSQAVANSNKYKPDIHIALHSNTFNKTARGCEIWCHKFGGKGEKLARSIYKYLSPLSPVEDRGIKEGYNRYGDGHPLYETAHTTAPAVLIEVGFHDNIQDVEWLTDCKEDIAIAIMNGINEYAGIPVVEVKPIEVIDYKAKYEELVAWLKEFLRLTKEE